MHTCTVCGGCGWLYFLGGKPYPVDEEIADRKICPACSGRGAVSDGEGPFGGNKDWLD